MSKLDNEFSTYKHHTFWVIASRNYPEKIVTNDKGIQIYLDPAEAEEVCMVKNMELWDSSKEPKPPKTYRVLRCEADTIEETDFRTGDSLWDAKE